MDKMEKIVALAKRRGFIFQGSEIYGGFKGFWDYGPVGVELKNNIKREWWKEMVQKRKDVVGIDTAIIMNPEVWEKSGHLEAFTDPLVDCKKCKKRFRADEIEGSGKCREGGEHEFTEERNFNLMMEVFLGVTEPKQKAYLRGEITQGAFVNFKNVLDSSRVKVPFGIAQIGKAFRNEITPGNFNFRSREFEQMELEFFIKPDEKDAKEVFEYWKSERMNWYINLGINKENLRFQDHAEDELVHYAKYATDIEYNSPFGGWKELEGIHNRGDWDLSRHKLNYRDPNTNEEYTPWVIETSGGVDRATLFLLLDAYTEENIDGKTRIFLKLNAKLAPFKACVSPLLANKPELVSKAEEIYNNLLNNFNVTYDARGNIGKRYAAQDEIGTPYCITVDFESLDDNMVTVRDRDSATQERVNIDKLQEFIFNKINEA